MHKATAKKLKQHKKAIPDKLFYKIGEVSRIAEVEPYVLRYWESEFPFLKPRKSKSGQRIYVKKDLDLVLQIKHMLYQERFTIEGVRKRFGEGNATKKTQEPKAAESMSRDKALEQVKSKLRDILNSIK